MDELSDIRGARLTHLVRQPSVRLIPATILQPRLRLVDGERLITGPAFSLENIGDEAASPSERLHVPANGVIAQRVLYSFEASRGQLNRYNAPGDEGVYYAGTTLPASIAEIQWHLENPKGLPQFDRTRAYRSVVADVQGRFLDLRGAKTDANVPDPAVSYPEGRRIAGLARKAGLDGIIYPSARHPDGTCLAVLERRAISSVRLGQMLMFEPYEQDGIMRYGYRNAIPQHLMRDRGMNLSR